VLQKAEKRCQDIRTILGKSINAISNSYREAGSQWKDDKYRQLGVIVCDCVSVLHKSNDELGRCMEKLVDIQRILQEYQNTNL
jgi:hypothetical protein